MRTIVLFTVVFAFQWNTNGQRNANSNEPNASDVERYCCVVPEQLIHNSNIQYGYSLSSSKFSFPLLFRFFSRFLCVYNLFFFILFSFESDTASDMGARARQR